MDRIPPCLPRAVTLSPHFPLPSSNNSVHTNVWSDNLRYLQVLWTGWHRLGEAEASTFVSPTIHGLSFSAFNMILITLQYIHRLICQNMDYFEPKCIIHAVINFKSLAVELWMPHTQTIKINCHSKLILGIYLCNGHALPLLLILWAYWVDMIAKYFLNNTKICVNSFELHA
jgi:hypothetical protein